MAAPNKTDACPLQHRGDESHLLREIARTHQVLMAGFSRQAGVPASQFALMRLLATNARDAGVMDLARRLGINAAAVTRLVKEMETEHLILRRADAKDRRRSYVRLSAQGLRIFEEVHARSHKLEHALSSTIGPGEIAVTLEVLSKVRNFIEGLR
jgi:DNA-binding MarR family transcriptional regulator